MPEVQTSGFRKWVLSSPPAEWALRHLRELLIGALSQGPIPRHVAFEMDGNRRFARSHKIETVEGHHLGFEALARVLEICYKCGVQVVTVYAFSIENYKRPQYEVEGLMQLAKVKLEQLVQHGELLERYGASVRVLGQRDLIREDVLEVVDKAVNRTKGYNNCILNICFPYTSREEITSAVRATVEEYSTPPQPHSTSFSQARITQKILSQDGKLDTLSSIREVSREPSPEPASHQSDELEDSVSSSTTLHPESQSPPLQSGGRSNFAIYPNAETITAATLDRHMYTADCPPLDLFVRTSGVERLSDFMLWQCHQETHIFFLKCFWPEFDLWHFLPVLVEWQRRMKQKEREQRPRKGIKQQ